MKTIKGRWVSALLASLFFCIVTIPAHANEQIEDFVHVGTAGDNGGIVVSATRVDSVPGSFVPGGVFDGSGEVEGVSGGGGVRVEPVVARTWCDKLFRDVVASHPCFRRFRVSDEPVDEERVDEGDGEFADPVSVMVSAVALARVEGAGLVVNPGRGWVYVGAPTLAHAERGEISTSVTVLGLDVPVTFRGSRFMFDFGYGAGSVVSTVPGAPYPDMSIQGTYLNEGSGVFVTLTTTWDAVVTHPLTGEVMSVPGALRTVEYSAPFEVVRSRHRLIAPEEFGNPH